MCLGNKRSITHSAGSSEQTGDDPERLYYNSHFRMLDIYFVIPYTTLRNQLFIEGAA
jgi:hypothetical protein